MSDRAGAGLGGSLDPANHVPLRDEPRGGVGDVVALLAMRMWLLLRMAAMAGPVNAGPHALLV